jgi:hypothetical protein
MLVPTDDTLADNAGIIRRPSQSHGPWPSDAPPCFLINEARCRHRLANMTEQFERAEIPFIRFAGTAEASSATSVTPSECALLSNTNCLGGPGCRCDGGVAGCAISHLRAWNASLTQRPNAPWHLFAEDQEILFTHGRERLLNSIAQVTAGRRNWSTIFFSPDRDDHFLRRIEGAGHIIQWLGSNVHGGVSLTRTDWTHQNQLTQSWASFYALSWEGVRNAITKVTVKGFQEALDYQLFDMCGIGNCFTVLGGVEAEHMMNASLVQDPNHSC